LGFMAILWSITICLFKDLKIQNSKIQ